MKQIIQDLKSGKTSLIEVPVPLVKAGHVLIRTHRSLVSLGTEKMLVDFGKANFLQKARQQPEKVKQVLQKVKTDGLRPTVDAVFRKLGEPLPLGYCNAGEVIGVGAGVTEFVLGDRVVSNGPHAEVVLIPENLVAKIPDDVSYDAAAFTVIGAIALQGIRLLKPTFGETIVVTGLGLIGLIAGQLLLANGCQVIGLDTDQAKVDLAKSWGVQALQVQGIDPVTAIQNITGHRGADAVLIAASTQSNEVIAQAAQMSRKRGRIVLVGVIGLELSRADFYEKEITFQVSCSYGPGRYDPEYEEKGHDYPLGFVRWTEKRNFEAILQALKLKQLQTDALITERVPLEGYQEIYNDMSKPGSIASIIEYASAGELATQVVITPKSFAGSSGVIGIIGAGNFTAGTVVPILAKLKSNLKYIASSKGLSATTLARKYHISQAISDYQTILDDAEVDAIIITTRHHTHADLVLKCLQHHKQVFVEKPLAIETDDLERISAAFNNQSKSVTVGYNRRFSPYLIHAKKTLGETGQPINVLATINAGFIPADHWVQDMGVGGGRIIGEACHFIDLITFLCGSLVTAVVMNAGGPDTPSNTDNASILLRYQNGSQGVINYFSNGHKSYPKERIEIYDQGKNIVIDNFRKSTYYGYPVKGIKSTQDKGHQTQFKKWLQLITSGGEPLIPFPDLINTSKAAIACIESLQRRSWIEI